MKSRFEIDGKRDASHSSSVGQPSAAPDPLRQDPLLQVPLRPRRHIDGISAVLLPVGPDGRHAFDAWEALLERTWRAGLTPAINMDTGFVNLLSAAQRRDVLRRAAALAAGRRFVTGAFIEGAPGAPLTLYLREVAAAREAGAIPILFQSTPLKAMARPELLGLYRRVASEAGEGSVPNSVEFGWRQTGNYAAISAASMAVGLGVRRTS